MKNSLISVLVTVTNTGKLCKQTSVITNLICADDRYDITLDYPTAIPYENNLNQIARRVIEEGFSYWLQIDSDNEPTKNPLDLIEYDKDLMILPYLQWYNTAVDGDYPLFIVAMDDVGEGFKEHKNTTGLQQIDAGGSGCMIVSRRVLEAIDIPFERTFDKYGRVEIGVDFNFCRKVRKKGFEIWCHYDYPVKHYKTIELMEMQRAFETYYAKKYGK